MARFQQTLALRLVQTVVFVSLILGFWILGTLVVEAWTFLTNDR